MVADSLRLSLLACLAYTTRNCTIGVRESLGSTSVATTLFPFSRLLERIETRLRACSLRSRYAGDSTAVPAAHFRGPTTSRAATKRELKFGTSSLPAVLHSNEAIPVVLSLP